MALTNKLTAIGDAIREKTGSTELLTLEQMATAIAGITGGGEGGAYLPEEAFLITGDCSYRFSNDGWSWFLNEYGNRITTNNITVANQMFYSSRTLTEIPFEINFKDGGASVKSMFHNCENLERVSSIDFKQTSYKGSDSMFDTCYKLNEIGTIKNLYPEALGKMFYMCQNLRYLPQFENLNLDRIYTYASASLANMFQGCYSLRCIPENFLRQLYTPVANGYFYVVFSSGFTNCYALDEIRGLNPQTGVITSNMFSNTFTSCYRVKDIIFETQEDGTPYSVNWKNQTIALMGSGKSVGVANNSSYLLNYNSGITADKEVTDDASYQALKNDPDWFTRLNEYSRFNHDSAVNLLNSLPDVTQGSSNVIKFTGEAGLLTDGGAISTLTEEEIAVAAAKGWTVSLT